MKKSKKFRKKIIELNNEEKEEVNVFKTNLEAYTKQEKPFSKEKNIYISDNLQKKLGVEGTKSIIYHEKMHKDKLHFLNYLSGLSFLIFGVLLAGLIILGMLGALNFVLIFVFLTKPYIYFLVMVGAFILFWILSWIMELSCDRNAVNNTNKKYFIKALTKFYDREYRNFFSKIWREWITHPPLKLRVWFTNKWD